MQYLCPGSGKPTEIDPTFCLAASSSFFFSSACFFCCSSCSSIESRMASININCNEMIRCEQGITSRCGEWAILPLRCRLQLPCRIQNHRCPYVLTVGCFGNRHGRHLPKWPEGHFHRWSARWVLCLRRLSRWYHHATTCIRPESACPRSTTNHQRGSVNCPATLTYSMHNDPSRCPSSSSGFDSVQLVLPIRSDLI